MAISIQTRCKKKVHCCAGIVSVSTGQLACGTQHAVRSSRVHGGVGGRFRDGRTYWPAMPSKRRTAFFASPVSPSVADKMVTAPPHPCLVPGPLAVSCRPCLVFFVWPRGSLHPRGLVASGHVLDWNRGCQRVVQGEIKRQDKGRYICICDRKI